MDTSAARPRLLSRFLLPLLVFAVVAWIAPAGRADETIPTRPRVPGTLRLSLRQRKEEPPGSGRFKVVG